MHHAIAESEWISPNWFQSCYSRLIDCDQKRCGIAKLNFIEFQLHSGLYSWLSHTFFFRVKSEWMSECKRIKKESSLENIPSHRLNWKPATKRWSLSLFNIETYYHRLQKLYTRYNINVFCGCGQCKSIISSYLIAQQQAPLWLPHTFVWCLNMIYILICNQKLMKITLHATQFRWFCNCI